MTCPPTGHREPRASGVGSPLLRKILWHGPDLEPMSDWRDALERARRNMTGRRAVGRSRRLLALLVGALAITLAGCDWVTLGYSSARTGYNVAESTIAPGNASALREAWRATIGVGPSDQSAATWSPVVGSNRVLVGSQDGVLRAFDKHGTTGCSGSPKICQPLWTAIVGGEPLTPSVVGGTVYVTANSTLYAFDVGGTANCSGVPKTCRPLWSASPAIDSPVVGNGVLYVSTGSTIAAFDAAGSTGCSGVPKTCQPLWSSQPAGCVGVGTECRFSAPSLANGKMYAIWAGNFELGQAYLQAFDAAGVTGCSGVPRRCSPLWQVFIRGNKPAPAPTISAGRVFVLANFVDVASGGQPGAWLAAHDANTGALVWDSQFFGTFAYPPVVANGRLYVSAGRVRVFDATGTQGCAPHGATRRCSGLFDIADFGIPGTAAVANGVLYDGSGPFSIEGTNTPAAVRAYDIATLTAVCGQFGACAPVWTTSALGGTTSAPVVSDGGVYVASAEGMLHAYRLP